MEIALALFAPEQIPAKLHDFADKDLLQHIYLARFLIGILPGIALGAAACYFFRNHTRRGLEGVRAQVFLSGLHSGNTVSDANYAASFGFMEQLPREVIQSAAALSKAEYGGRTFPIIAEAYRRGMKPKLPIWQRIIILGSARSPQKEVPSQVKPGATPYRHALNLYKYPT